MSTVNTDPGTPRRWALVLLAFALGLMVATAIHYRWF